MPTDLKGLNNFIRRIKQVKQLEIVAPNVSHAIAEKGAELARTAYSSSDISRAEVTNEPSLDGDYAVVAQGKGLAFEEYGTGYYAEGTYKGDLPTETITFESAGKQQSTQGWEYYYDNPDTKITVGGTKGWLLGNNFMVGENAGNQMYNTSVKLREEAKNIASDKIRELIE